MKEPKIGDKVFINTLEVEIRGFKYIGHNKMIVTDYGEFNIDLITQMD